MPGGLFFIILLILLLTDITITDLFIYIASFILFYCIYKIPDKTELNNYQNMGRLRYYNIINHIREPPKLNDLNSELNDIEKLINGSNILPVRIHIEINNVEFNLGVDEFNEEPYKDEITPIFDKEGRIFIKDDYENVHNSCVNNSIKHCIDNLLKTKEKFKEEKENFIYDIQQKILKKIEKNFDYFKILKLLDFIYQSRNVHVISCGHKMSIYNVLDLVWIRINSYLDLEKRENAIDNLLLELLDCCKEQGDYECYTGILNRIIDSLSGIDLDMVIIPDWLIKREMMNKAGVIREKILNSLSEKELIDYENEESTVYKKFVETFRNLLFKDFKSNYSNYMKEEEILKEINLWIDYL